ncbi:MAG TPA: pirin family protein, partial [Mycobacterium sp.]|nr:pirin family protein [Mycobacterium sp.]
HPFGARRGARCQTSSPRHLATETYPFDDGMLRHGSLGNRVAIRPGEINLVVAGHGIAHSERLRAGVKAAGNTLE